MSNQIVGKKPTAFDELRYGYFDTSFGNILKAIRGGTNPIGVTTLCMCTAAAWSEIDWAINNQHQLEATGELKKNAKPGDRKLFEAWLNRWVRDTGINANCDATRTYGLRCALVHSGAGSEALSKTGVGAWYITMKEPAEHYSVKQAVDVMRFRLDMPEFLAELILAADRSLNDQKTILEQASPELRLRIGFIAGPMSGDLSSRLVNNIGSLAWFDKVLPTTPLQISKTDLAQRIRNAYDEAVKAGLVFDYTNR